MCMVKFWPDILPEIEENLRKRTFSCFNCGLKYEMDGDGVEAAKNTPVRRKCPKCGNWMRVMLHNGTFYDVSSDSRLTPNDIRKKSTDSGRSTSNKKKDSDNICSTRGGNHSETIDSSPFNEESKFSKIIPNQGYIDTCPECGKDDTVWFGQRQYGVKTYSILKCEMCGATWADKATFFILRRSEDWASIDSENKLKNETVRRRIKKQTTASRIYRRKQQTRANLREIKTRLKIWTRNVVISGLLAVPTAIIPFLIVGVPLILISPESDLESIILVLAMSYIIALIYWVWEWYKHDSRPEYQSDYFLSYE